MISYLRRSLFVFLALVISVAAVPLLTPSTANAWTGTLPSCNVSLSADFVTNMDAASPGWENKPYVIYQRAWWGTQTVIDAGDAVQFTKSGEYQMITSPSSVGYDIHADGTVAMRYNNSSFGFTDITCVQAAHQANYNASWDVAQFPTTYDSGGGGTAPLYNTCATLDFVCYYGNVMTFFGIVGGFIGDFFTNIGNTITNFSVSLMDSVTSLFVPKQNHFTDTFSALGSFFQQKFGFLAWPVTFLANLITGLSTTGDANTCVYGGQGPGIYSFCSLGLSAPAGIIPAFNINFGAIEQNWPSLWQYLQTALIGITVFGLVTAIYHKYMRIIKS